MISKFNLASVSQNSVQNEHSFVNRSNRYHMGYTVFVVDETQ